MYTQINVLLLRFLFHHPNCSTQGMNYDLHFIFPRFYPSVPITLRQAVEEDVLCGYRIPKGTILLLAQGAMMRYAT